MIEESHFSHFELSETIRSELNFFTKPYIFQSEADLIFDYNNSKSELNADSNSQQQTENDKNIDPTYSPDLENSDAKYDIQPSKLYQPSFLVLGQKAKRNINLFILFSGETGIYLLDQTNNSITPFPTSLISLTENGKLQIGTESFTFMSLSQSEPNDKANASLDLPGITKLVNQILKKPNNNESSQPPNNSNNNSLLEPELTSFYFLSQSLTLFQGFPNYTCDYFYHSFIHSIQFLSLFLNIPYDMKDSALCQAWVHLAGRNFPKFLPFIIHTTFPVLNAENTIFRSKTFVTFLLKQILFFDPGWTKFIQDFVPDNKLITDAIAITNQKKSSPISNNNNNENNENNTENKKDEYPQLELFEYFLDKFNDLIKDKVLNPLSRFIIFTIIDILKKKFPQLHQIPYNGISGILFLRSFFPDYCIIHTPKNPLALKVSQIVNLVTIFQWGPDYAKRLMDIFDMAYEKPNDYVPELDTPEDIKIVIQHIIKHPGQFSDSIVTLFQNDSKDNFQNQYLRYSQFLASLNPENNEGN